MQDYYESWSSFLALRSKLEAECAQQIFDAIATDEAVPMGLGAAHLLKDAVTATPAQVPTELLKLLKQGPGKHVKSHAYTYRRKIDAALTKIGRIQTLQGRAVALTGTAIVAALVGFNNVIGRLFYDLLKSNPTMAAIIAGVAIGALLLVVIAFATLIRRMRRG